MFVGDNVASSSSSSNNDFAFHLDVVAVDTKAAPPPAHIPMERRRVSNGSVADIRSTCGADDTSLENGSSIGVLLVFGVGAVAGRADDALVADNGGDGDGDGDGVGNAAANARGFIGHGAG